MNLTMPGFVLKKRPLCAEVDPELFFPDGSGHPATQAKAICRRCEALEECLAWALSTHQEHGIWGALSPDERRAIRRAK